MKKKSMLYLIIGIFGIAVIVSAIVLDGKVTDAVNGRLMGVGAGLTGLGISMWWFFSWVKKDPAKWRQYEIESNDERNVIIKFRAKAVAGEVLQWTVMVAAWVAILQTARIYSNPIRKVSGWRSAVGSYCKFNRCVVYILECPDMVNSLRCWYFPVQDNFRDVPYGSGSERDVIEYGEKMGKPCGQTFTIALALLLLLIIIMGLFFNRSFRNRPCSELVKLQALEAGISPFPLQPLLALIWNKGTRQAIITLCLVPFFPINICPIWL